MRQNPIRIASGQGFWGDLPIAPIRQVRDGAIDYLMMDYLAEVTMSILQKQKNRNPAHGYALDFVNVIAEILPDIAAGKVKVLSNAGGVNPKACVAAIQAVAESNGIRGLKIAVVDGDDILAQLDALINAGHPLKHMESGERAEAKKAAFLSANV